TPITSPVSGNAQLAAASSPSAGAGRSPQTSRVKNVNATRASARRAGQSRVKSSRFMVAILPATRPILPAAARWPRRRAVYNELMPAIGEKPNSFKAEAALWPILRNDVAVSLRMLVLIRWVAVIGQAVTRLVVHEVLGFALPLTAALGVVAISALLNVVAWISNRAAARLGNREA